MIRLSQRVPYSLPLVHQVIADVPAYPSFVPGVVAARVAPCKDGLFDADLDVVILGKPYTYRSHVMVDPLCVRAEASTFLGDLNVAWHLRAEGEEATHIDFHLNTSIPGLSWLMPEEWPTRIMNAFAKRCADFAE